MRHCLLPLAATLLLTATAHADLKLVQQSSMSGELAKRLQKEGGLKPPSVTTYYKGNRLRTETGDRVTIFDGKRMLLLDPAKKTYQVLPKDLAGSTTGNPMLAMVDMQAEVSVKPTGKSQTILGKRAQQYLLTVTMKLNMKPGATGAEGQAKQTMQFPPVTSKTELWTAEFPGISLSAASAGQNLPAGMGNLPGLKDIVEKMKAVKGVPLQTTMTQDVMGRQMVVTVKTTALSEASLPESLFAPPVGFKQVPYEGPSLNGMPGMPGKL